MLGKDGPIARQRATNARLLLQASGIAARHELLTSAHDTERTEVRATLPVVMLPANTRDTVTMSPRSRHAFMTSLRAMLHRVYAAPVRDNAAAMSVEDMAARDDARDPSAAAQSATQGVGTAAITSAPPVTDHWDVAAVLAAGCATCRGECCTAGGTHAFLREDSLLRVRAQFFEDGHAMDEAQLAAEYASYLPARHYRGSCVFHTANACALPRGLRSTSAIVTCAVDSRNSRAQCAPAILAGLMWRRRIRRICGAWRRSPLRARRSSR